MTQPTHHHDHMQDDLFAQAVARTLDRGAADLPPRFIVICLKNMPISTLHLIHFRLPGGVALVNAFRSSRALEILLPVHAGHGRPRWQVAKQWQSALQLAGQGTHRAIDGLFGDTFGSATDWRRWALSAGILLLTGSFMFWQAQSLIENQASVDSALLSEALPPNALIDKGFQAWLSSGTPAETD